MITFRILYCATIMILGLCLSVFVQDLWPFWAMAGASLLVLISGAVRDEKR